MTLDRKKIFFVTKSIPDLPAPPIKNLFDITGVSNKENINSRVISYFLNPEEDHELNSLFFDSFKELLIEKSSNDGINSFVGNFTIALEEETSLSKNELDNLKRIDILLESVNNDWAIIIENKLYHNLSNPLHAYWEHVKNKRNNSQIIGVVLSLFPVSNDDSIALVDDKEEKFINITHEELIKRVQSNFLFNQNVTNRTLFILKEYFSTIQSHYQYKMEQPINNEIVKQIALNNDLINEIFDKFEQAKLFLGQQIESVFSEFGYSKEGSYYGNPNIHKDLFFWILPVEQILKENRIWFCFEAWNETNLILREHGASLINKLERINDSSILSYGHQHRSKAMFHIAKFDGSNFMNGDTNFSDKLRGILQDYFFDEDKIHPTVIGYLKDFSHQM